MFDGGALRMAGALGDGGGGDFFLAVTPSRSHHGLVGLADGSFLAVCAGAGLGLGSFRPADFLAGLCRRLSGSFLLVITAAYSFDPVGKSL